MKWHHMETVEIYYSCETLQLFRVKEEVIKTICVLFTRSATVGSEAVSKNKT